MSDEGMSGDGMGSEADAKLLYFADPMCSWCYGFSPVISKLAERLPVEVILGGLRPGETRPLNGQLRDEIQNHWRHVHEASGQPFDFEQGLPDGFVYDTEPACRAVVTIRELKPSATLPMLAALHQAFYRDARDVKTDAVVGEIAESLGANKAQFLHIWNSAVARNATLADFERSREFGITGYPALILQLPERARLITLGYEPEEQVMEKIGNLGVPEDMLAAS